MDSKDYTLEELVNFRKCDRCEKFTKEVDLEVFKFVDDDPTTFFYFCSPCADTVLSKTDEWEP